MAYFGTDNRVEDTSIDDFGYEDMCYILLDSGLIDSKALTIAENILYGYGEDEYSIDNMYRILMAMSGFTTFTELSEWMGMSLDEEILKARGIA